MFRCNLHQPEALGNYDEQTLPPKHTLNIVGDEAGKRNKPLLVLFTNVLGVVCDHSTTWSLQTDVHMYPNSDFSENRR